ncbi:peroxidase family protein [Microbulbifer marinus]|uniref:Animal haem peroxidase n=1 Tax=Microbulbifer marinus TaxID=658218 RepID=A0A1H3Z4D9_9GAMM|nr:peroxidase family protein [Microbulbifer marinus]SEA18152.1 Animal haem peroxidase [Microbulbifer marinus]
MKTGMCSLLAAVSMLSGAISNATPFTEYRSIDGTGNNLELPLLGSTNSPLLRRVTPAYSDGISLPAGSLRPNPRVISNAICQQIAPQLDSSGHTSMVFQWGQFLDHDLSLTTTGEESVPIPVPPDDPVFTIDSSIRFHRSLFHLDTGTPTTPRQQINQVTAFIDASQVYGSDLIRATALRTNDGTGKLDTSRFDLLPFNTSGLPNDGGPDSDFYLAGDIRANEQVGLTALHVLFVREHNRLATALHHQDKSLSGDEIYYQARAIVGAQMQVITYREFLPAVLGPDSLAPYAGYVPTTDPGIANAFSTAAFRFGHSMLSSELLRLKSNGEPIPEGNLSLRDAFFTRFELNPESGKGIEPLLRGLASQVAQAVDTKIVDGVRNFLFGSPDQGPFDLAALNIQRGRDHGLPGYNAMRIELGLAPAADYEDITSDPQVSSLLRQVYGPGNVSEVDPWIGGLAEDKLPDAMVGPLFHLIIRDQFERLRDGDRFWYQAVFSAEILQELESTTLADIICRNTQILPAELNENVFISNPNPSTSAP